MMNITKGIVCPYCRKETVKTRTQFWPFCSQHCQALDLGAWAKEEYSIAGEAVTEEASLQAPEEET